MLSKVKAGRKKGEPSGDDDLLKQIEYISKALYAGKTSSKSYVSTLTKNQSKPAEKTHFAPKESNGDPLQKGKKSIWGWKALKDLTRVRNRRFGCCFSLEVHSIEGLPSAFDNRSLCVHWKGTDVGLLTWPVRSFQGRAEFEEQLTHSCSVYGSRSGAKHAAKYEAKFFMLYAAVLGAPELDLGKHRVDLTRFLPISLEELEEKNTRKWTTSFKLSGMAKGANLIVSFGYKVIGSNSIATTSNREIPEASTNMVNSVEKIDHSDFMGAIRRTGSLPASSLTYYRFIDDMKDLHEVLPVSRSEFSDSVNTLSQKFEEERLVTDQVACEPEPEVSSEPLEYSFKSHNYLANTGKENAEKNYEDGDFSAMSPGIVFSAKEQVKSEEGTLKDSDSTVIESFGHPKFETDVGLAIEEETKLHSRVKEFGCHGDNFVSDFISKEKDMCTNESVMKNLESDFNNMFNVPIEVVSQEGADHENPCPEFFGKFESNFETIRKGRSVCLDNVTNSVAGEFFDMLGIEHSPLGSSSESEPESPRERLLRQFEEETLAAGCSLFNFDIEDENLAEYGYETPTGSGWEVFNEDFNPFPMVQAVEKPKLSCKTIASMLEVLESEALMDEWGLNEKAFQSSPPNYSGAFGSPISQ